MRLFYLNRLNRLEASVPVGLLLALWKIDLHHKAHRDHAQCHSDVVHLLPVACQIYLSTLFLVLRWKEKKRERKREWLIKGHYLQ